MYGSLKKNQPPRLVRWLLWRIISREIRDSDMGDFDEIYFLLVAEKGRFKAGL
jgi:hypothetical protein